MKWIRDGARLSLVIPRGIVLIWRAECEEISGKKVWLWEVSIGEFSERGWARCLADAKKGATQTADRWGLLTPPLEST